MYGLKRFVSCRVVAGALQVVVHAHMAHGFKYMPVGCCKTLRAWIASSILLCRERSLNDRRHTLATVAYGIWDTERW